MDTSPIATVKFSHFYQKQPTPQVEGSKRPTFLLQVFTVDKSELSQEFIDYDTLYYVAGKPNYYPLPDGKLLVLFLKTGGHAWTTLRRWTHEKETYYRGLQGQRVETALISEGNHA